MNTRPRNVVILGATGSIGESALRVMERHPDRLRLLGVAAHSQGDKLCAIAHQFQVPYAALVNGDAGTRNKFPESTRVMRGMDSLQKLSTLPDADLILVAVVGTAGLAPTLAALEAGKDIAIANKEVLVMAGAFVMEAARRSGARILPADSEHNAIFQCMEATASRGQRPAKIILTASGGPFLGKSLDELKSVTPAEALRHPNWDMGTKVTLDSATMANKGLELIEAHWLFGLPPSRIEVVIHPQSVVHSMVQSIDGSILAQMSPPSMTFPIQHCLLYPDRAPGVEASLDFSQSLHLDFFPPDETSFPCLRLARESLQLGMTAPCIFNAANEVAASSFLEGRIGFLDIPRIIDKVLEHATITDPLRLEDVLDADRDARRLAAEFTDR